MILLKHATAGTIFLMAAGLAGLAGCDGGDPAATGTTNPPAAQSSEAPAQAVPAPAGEQEQTGTEKPANSN